MQYSSFFNFLGKEAAKFAISQENYNRRPGGRVKFILKLNILIIILLAIRLPFF